MVCTWPANVRGRITGTGVDLSSVKGPQGRVTWTA